MVARVFFIALLCLAPVIYSEKLQTLVPCQRGNFGTANVQEVRITPCPEALLRRPCILKRGTNVSIEVDFTPTVAANKVTGKAFWANRMVELPLPNMNTNACESLNCPVQANSAQTYRYVLPVSRTFPTRRYDVRWKLQNNPGFNVCFQFPIQIVN